MFFTYLIDLVILIVSSALSQSYNTNMLNKKTIKYIHGNNGTTLKNEPTSKYQTQITTLVKIAKNLIDTNQKHNYVMNNLNPSKLNSLIKIKKIKNKSNPL